MTLTDYRRDFERTTNRSVSMPITGALVWLLVGVLSAQFDERISIYIMLFATGAIYPLARLIANFRNEIFSSFPLCK